jgi:hypothetical protein
MINTVKWFDEMAILQADKDRRVDTADRFGEALLSFFQQQLLDLRRGHFLNEKSHDDYIDDLYAMYLAFIPATYRYERMATDKAMRFAEGVQETTEKAVLENKDENFRDMVIIGGRVKDIPEDVLDKLGETRAHNDGVYEATWIWNFYNHMELAKTQITHTWQTMEDERVRLTHAEADLQTVPINVPFTVGGYQMMFPGDDSLGAPLKEIIGCRCVEL